MAEARETFVDSQGLSIHCLEWGEPSGEPLVLIHGYLDLAHSWRAFVAALEKKHGDTPWIIAPDCRGHGDSGWVGAGLDARILTKMTAAALAHFGDPLRHAHRRIGVSHAGRADAFDQR